MDILNVVAGNYPVPESFVTLSLTGGYAIYQGFAKENTERVSRISAGAALDPSDKSMYITYSTTSNGKKMQLMTFLENGSAISLLSPLIPGVYASSASDYSKRYPYALGDNL